MEGLCLGDEVNIWWITYRVSSNFSALIGFSSAPFRYKFTLPIKNIFQWHICIGKIQLVLCRFGLLKSCMEIKLVNSIIVFHTTWSSLWLKILIRMSFLPFCYCIFCLTMLHRRLTLDFLFYFVFSNLGLPPVMNSLVEVLNRRISEPDYVV